MDRILAPDFLEFGGSGNVHTREAVLSAPRSPINAELPLSDFRVQRLSADVVHVTYNTDRKSTRLNSSHVKISYAVFCLKKKKKKKINTKKKHTKKRHITTR